MSLTPLPSSGPIGASQINVMTEKTSNATFKASNIATRHLAGKLSGAISWSDARGKTGVVLSNLVAHLDCGYTSSYPGSGTTWTDMTGNGNTGTLVTGASYNSANKGSIAFNGSTGGVALPHNSFWTTSNASNFSFSIWVNASTAPAGGMVFSHQRCNTPALQLFISTTNASFRLENVSAVYSVNITGAWHHMVGTYNGSTRLVKLYVDGSTVATATATDNWSMTAGGSDLWLGRRTWCGATNEIAGKIASFSFHQRTLTDAEVAKTYHTSVARFA